MNWGLNTSQFSIFDKIKICLFMLNNKNRWTQDKQVKLFEKEIAKIIGVKYAVFVSSGSTANTLLAQYTKDSSKDFQAKNIVVLPSTTWQTSCSPWIREGFAPKFIDISLEDFCMDRGKLLEYVEENHDKIACIFPTSLIGFCQNLDFYLDIEKRYNIKVFFDNCENTLSNFKTSNISSYFTSTTSTYFGHQIQSIEGGFIFTNSDKEYEYFLMNRNHGMVRSLSSYNRSTTNYTNDKVDPMFDFYSLGNNFRNSDVNALIGRLDLRRFNRYKNTRKKIYKIFKENLDKDKFYLPQDRTDQEDVPFCLPIIIKNNNKNLVKKCIEFCKNQNIEYRPVVSGYLGHQTCYKEFFTDLSKYPNSLYIHEHGFYIGLHQKVKEKDVIFLVKNLNKL